MALHAQNKGKEGEREVCTMLNVVVNRVRTRLGKPLPPVPDFQRNQNQSAVGGSDVKNPYQLAIEVKRQESLSINTWWSQIEKAALRDGEVPVLIFKQNRKKWRVLMYGALPLLNGQISWQRVEISHETFLEWVEKYLEAKLGQGDQSRSQMVRQDQHALAGNGNS